MSEFSFRTREIALQRFREERFDLLIIGGGITGAGVARDAVSRGLKVAVVEKNDFAFGTSSRSSKLIHGGLRYLENLEFSLVFEALAERAFLLKAVPHMVRPLPFLLPVYQGDAHGRGILNLGLWFYDLLALFRTPGFHRSLSKKKMLKEVPFLKEEGLSGGFRYYDASMWDDVLAVQTLRSAQNSGAVVANYVEAVKPIWTGERITGYTLRDLEKPASGGKGEFEVHAKRVVVCAGPWTDQVGAHLSPTWQRWLNPSKGVHLVFDLKRIPIPGALVMSHPSDGRISFVIPRPDFGTGVVIVGTTDGPTPLDPDQASIESADVQYLMELLQRYFPSLELKTSDILSGYVGVRPLMGNHVHRLAGSEGQRMTTGSLQKVSREHHIGLGPGATVIVAGGKYTTHRKMAEEIVEFTLRTWRQDAKKGKAPALPQGLKRPSTKSPINPAVTDLAIRQARTDAEKKGFKISSELYERFGSDALEVVSRGQSQKEDPAAFPFLESQLRQAIRKEMVIHLEDFYLRRLPLFASRSDQGLPWAERLASIWAEERGLGEAEARQELALLKSELERRSLWKKKLVESASPGNG